MADIKNFTSDAEASMAGE